MQATIRMMQGCREGRSAKGVGGGARGEGREEGKLRVSGWVRGAGEGSAVLDRSGGDWGRG